MSKRDRPWHKHAQVERVEFNNGDVKYSTSPKTARDGFGLAAALEPVSVYSTSETLDAAMDHLDDWWKTQVKKRSRV